MNNIPPFKSPLSLISKRYLFLFLLLLKLSSSTAQNDSSLITLEAPNDKFKTRLLPSMIAPAILIAYGVSTIKDNGIYSSYEARRDIQRITNEYRGPIDDYLILSPYLGMAALTAFKVNCTNDLINTSLLILKSQIIMATLTFSLKETTLQERPYSFYGDLPESEKDPKSNRFKSFPSGHTAQAFVAATIVYREYRKRSVWYGVGAYTLASTVGAFRMINDRHWQSDVFVGAGIGILSANLAYATHIHRWGRTEVCFTPIYNQNIKGLTFVCNF